MQYRKLIKFGNSSHVISIPNDWLKKNNLNKGDVIYIEENGNNELILNSEKKDKVVEEKEIIIEVQSKNERELEREIISAYINNYKTIKIVGRDIEKRSHEIRSYIKNLSGLEVLEQAKDHIIAKDFINLKSISPMHLIRRMDILTRNMLTDSKETLNNESIYESLIQRDQDINRLVFLVYRISKYYIENPDGTLKNNLKSIDMVVIWQIADHLERFADETKRTARFLTKIKIDKKQQKEMERLFEEIEQAYSNAMKAFYTKDRSHALKVAGSTKELIDKCDALREEVNVKEVIILMERFKAMIDYIRTISRLIYN